MTTTNLTNEIYRKIYTELISAIKGDPTFQQELSKDQVDFIEQNWHKKMDEANLHIKQSQEFTNFLFTTRPALSYTPRSQSVGSFAQTAIQLTSQPETLYGGNIVSAKQNTLIKHFGNERAARLLPEPREEKIKSRGLKRVKEAQKFESESDVFEDSLSVDRKKLDPPATNGTALPEKQTIDINLNLTDGDGLLQKRETLSNDNDDKDPFVR